MIGRLARGLRSHGERRTSRRPYVHHKEAPVTIRSVLTRLAATGAITATMAVAAPVAAQDATPAEDTVGGGCTAEPRAIDELVGLYFDPQGMPAATPTPEIAATEANLPAGESVDPEVEAQLNAVLTQIFTCFEAGQYARAFNLMTDDLARQFGPDVSNPDEDTAEEVQALLEAQLTGTPIAEAETEEGLAAADVGQGRDFRMLDDGRVGGIWTAQGESVFVVFEQQDGRWLADAFVGIADAAAAGTPAP
jgi:hypothetical protein